MKETIKPHQIFPAHRCFKYLHFNRPSLCRKACLNDLVCPVSQACVEIRCAMQFCIIFKENMSMIVLCPRAATQIRYDKSVFYHAVFGPKGGAWTTSSQAHLCCFGDVLSRWYRLEIPARKLSELHYICRSDTSHRNIIDYLGGC